MVVHSLQRRVGIAFGVLCLSLPMLVSAPSMAVEDVPVDPAIVLPPDPVWPEPPAPLAQDAAAMMSPMLMAPDLSAASDVPAMLMLPTFSPAPDFNPNP